MRPQVDKKKYIRGVEEEVELAKGTTVKKIIDNSSLEVGLSKLQ